MTSTSHDADTSTTEEEEKDIISELKVLQHVGAHPNIVNLLGAAVNDGMATSYLSCVCVALLAALCCGPTAMDQYQRLRAYHLTHTCGHSPASNILYM